MVLHLLSGKRIRPFLFLSLWLIVFPGIIQAEEYNWRLPPGFPVPRVPENNPMSAVKVQLGRHLFYDKRLSSTASVSCATCHQQSRAFTDGRKVSVGERGDQLKRSSMSLVNLAYRSSFGWSNPNFNHLEQQMLQPLFNQTPIEMGSTRTRSRILDALRGDDTYQAMFAQAFPGQADFMNWENIIKAIACFERTLISGRSVYDQWLFADRRPSDSVVRGMRLYFSKRLGCGGCHGGIGFNNEFYFRDVPQPGPTYRFSGIMGDDRGLAEITLNASDNYFFKVPTLRNIKLTAPYMHDGRFPDLEAVIEHYASGPAPDRGLAGFNLRKGEQMDLQKFLDALTDPVFTSDARWSDPG